MLSCAVCIPARLAGNRFPRKLLADLNGKTVIERTVDNVVSLVPKTWPICIMVAESDEKEIADSLGDRVVEYGRPGGSVQVFTTPDDCPTGSDRCAYPLTSHDLTKDVMLVVQGDEPFLTRDMLIRPYRAVCIGDSVATPFITLPSHDEDVDNRDNVKVQMDRHGRALWFHRDAITRSASHVAIHVGVYAYEASQLRHFPSIPRAELEIDQGLEQLRLLDWNVYIRCVQCDGMPLSINTPADLERARKIF